MIASSSALPSMAAKSEKGHIIIERHRQAGQSVLAEVMCPLASQPVTYLVTQCVTSDLCCFFQLASN
jgi:hypothetical protein